MGAMNSKTWKTKRMREIYYEPCRYERFDFWNFGLGYTSLKDAETKMNGYHLRACPFCKQSVAHIDRFTYDKFTVSFFVHCDTNFRGGCGAKGPCKQILTNDARLKDDWVEIMEKAVAEAWGIE